MSTGNRDVTLGVGIKTTGEDALKSLAAEVQNLAKRGGDAAPAYQQLADELTRLSEQAGQLSAFKTLSADVEKLTVDQEAAAAASSQYAVSLEQQRQETQDLSRIESQALADLKATKDAIAGKRYELAQLNIDTDRASKSDDAYLKTSRDLKQAILDLGVELRGRKEAMQQATADVKEAEAAEAKLESQYNRSAKAASGIETALSAQREAMARAGAQAQALGADIGNVAAAEENLLSTQQELVNGVMAARTAAMREQAEADRLAAIETNALNDLYAQGRIELQAEVAAINEAAAAAQRYAQFQADVAVEVARLESEEQKAAAAMRATADATTKANEAALAASRNADYIAFWARSADELAAAEKRAADELSYLQGASDRAAAALRDAFGSTGVRSLQAIQQEVNSVGQALTLLRDQYEAGAIGAKDLERASSSAQVRLAQLRQEMLNVPTTPNIFERMNTSINDLIGKFGTLSAAIATFGFATKPIIDANIELENLRKTLTAVTGSTQAANQQIEFLRQTALDNGIAVGALTGEYSNFVASMLKSGQSLETTQSLFRGIAQASNTLGISADRTGLILLALSQTANKGKVSLEEVQKQIGESMPGALKIMADSLGISTSEFTKLIEKGELMSNQFLPAFAAGLEKSFGQGTNQATTLAQAIGRVQTAVTTAAQEVSDTSAWRALISVTEGVANNIGAITTGVGVMVRGFLAFKAISVVADFLEIGRGAQVAAAAKADLAAATARNTAATVEEGAAEAEAATVRRASTAAVVAETEATVLNTAAKTANAAATAGTSGASAAWAAAQSKIGDAVSGVANKIGSLTAALGGPYGAALAAAAAFAKPLGEGLAYVAAKMTGAIGEIERYEAAQAKLNAMQSESSRLDGERAAALVKYMVIFDKLQEAAEKAADAKKIEGEVSVQIAALFGDETKTRVAAAAAADANVAASKRVFDATAEELRIQQQKLDAIERESGGRSKLTSEQQKQVVAIQQLIDKYTAERDIAKNRLDDLKLEADRRQLAAWAAKDNSDQIDALRAARDRDAATLARYTELDRLGLVVGTDLNAMKENLSKSEYKLRDALGDASAKIEGRLELMRAEYAQLVARQSVDKSYLDAQIKSAELQGNDRLATDLKVQSKWKEIEAVRTAAVEKVNEANKTIAQLEIDREALIGTDDATRKKRDAIDASIANAKAKLIEAQASGNVVTGLLAEIDAMQRKALVSNQTTNSVISDIDREAAARAKRLEGNTGPVDNSLPFTLLAKQQSGTLTVDDLASAQAALLAAQNNAKLGGPGSVSLEGRANDQKWISQLQAIVDQIKAMQYAASNPPKPRGLSAGGGSTASSSATDTTHTVNLTLNGGQQTSVNTASAADSDTLVKFLQQLQSAQGRSA